MSQPSARYHHFAIILHWLMALCIIGLLVVGLLMEDIKPISLRIDVIQLHKSLGITVLFLTLMRIWWRIKHPAPPLPRSMKPHEKLAAHAGHWGLYALMLIMPLSGWLMAWASNYPTIFFLIDPLPAIPFPEWLDKKALMGGAHATHKTSTIFIAIPMIVLHISAALFHQFVRKDKLFTRMLPSRKS